ncbi:MAG: Zn-dependent hydrolase [Verrucomicrobia bacterium]|nr:Zn-dependent hydrolase [Verrucomicrobiota bacterium]
MATPRDRARRVQTRLEELALVSEEESVLTRTYGSAALRDALRLTASWAADAGLAVQFDAIGNLRARTRGNARQRLLLGSHLDTVRNAGRFDGALGVLVALDCIAARGPLRKAELELIGFCDEEGVRFHTTYLGSRAVAGTFDPGDLALRDAAGIALGEAIRANGGDPRQLDTCIVPRDGLLGYLEVHLEQGPVLEAAGEPLGIVSAIAGQTRIAVEFIGRAGHAGTTPMSMRRDALTAAAEFVLAAESSARMQSGIVATVGEIEVRSAASNVIPGRVALTVDVRSGQDAARRVAAGTLEHLARSIATRRSLQIEWRVVMETPAARCDPNLCAAFMRAVEAADGNPLPVPSGAGHDAAAFIAAGIPAAMLFVRCRAGVSHHPDEFVALEDIEAAIAVLDGVLREIA